MFSFAFVLETGEFAGEFVRTGMVEISYHPLDVLGDPVREFVVFM